MSKILFNITYILKSFSYINKGIIGIAKNQNLSFTRKVKLYSDYCRLLFLAFRSLFAPRLSDPKIDKVFYSKAFNYQVHYPTFQSFFFTFNEIFCIGCYPAISNLKTYVDLGSNIGLTILWYHFFNPKITIYAFEPDLSVFKFLKKNIKKANIKNCFLYNIAISNKVQRTRFYTILDPIQNLDSGLSLNMPLPFKTSSVSTKKLSTIIKKIGKVSLIKMDIEGEEYKVFKEIFSTKAINNVEKIFFEGHYFNKIKSKPYFTLLNSLRKIGKVESYDNSEGTTMVYFKK